MVLALFALFAVGAFHVIRKTDDPFVRIVSGAITVWIVGQALINIGVVLRVFPVLGVPLPFMSQGGTSLLSVLVAVGRAAVVRAHASRGRGEAPRGDPAGAAVDSARARAPRGSRRTEGIAERGARHPIAAHSADLLGASARGDAEPLTAAG